MKFSCSRSCCANQPCPLRNARACRAKRPRMKCLARARQIRAGSSDEQDPSRKAAGMSLIEQVDSMLGSMGDATAAMSATSSAQLPPQTGSRRLPQAPRIPKAPAVQVPKRQQVPAIVARPQRNAPIEPDSDSDSDSEETSRPRQAPRKPTMLQRPTMNPDPNEVYDYDSDSDEEEEPAPAAVPALGARPQPNLPKRPSRAKKPGTPVAKATVKRKPAQAPALAGPPVQSSVTKKIVQEAELVQQAARNVLLEDRLFKAKQIESLSKSDPEAVAKLRLGRSQALEKVAQLTEVNESALAETAAYLLSIGKSVKGDAPVKSARPVDMSTAAKPAKSEDTAAVVKPKKPVEAGAAVQPPQKQEVTSTNKSKQVRPAAKDVRKKVDRKEVAALQRPVRRVGAADGEKSAAEEDSDSEDEATDEPRPEVVAARPVLKPVARTTLEDAIEDTLWKAGKAPPKKKKKPKKVKKEAVAVEPAVPPKPPAPASKVQEAAAEYMKRRRRPKPKSLDEVEPDAAPAVQMAPPPKPTAQESQMDGAAAYMEYVKDRAMERKKQRSQGAEEAGGEAISELAARPSRPVGQPLKQVPPQRRRVIEPDREPAATKDQTSQFSQPTRRQTDDLLMDNMKEKIPMIGLSTMVSKRGLIISLARTREGILPYKQMSKHTRAKVQKLAEKEAWQAGASLRSGAPESVRMEHPIKVVLKKLQGDGLFVVSELAAFSDDPVCSNTDEHTDPLALQAALELDEDTVVKGCVVDAADGKEGLRVQFTVRDMDLLVLYTNCGVSPLVWGCAVAGPVENLRVGDKIKATKAGDELVDGMVPLRVIEVQSSTILSEKMTCDDPILAAESLPNDVMHCLQIVAAQREVSKLKLITLLSSPDTAESPQVFVGKGEKEMDEGYERTVVMHAGQLMVSLSIVSTLSKGEFRHLMEMI